MTMYSQFASVYDSLMSNVDYKKRSSYIMSLFEEFGAKPSLLLDVACGTGGFSNEFASLGIDVIGVDISEEMLMQARSNSQKLGNDILYLCQSAEDLDLYGTVDGAICCLDSLNHITDYENLCKAFNRISLFLESGKLFIFDVNSVYKHKTILSNNTFVLDNDDIYCVWQNEFDEKELTTLITLDFFTKSGEHYIRSGEEFEERAYTLQQLKTAIEEANLKILAVYDDMSRVSPSDNSERLIYITQKL